MSHADAQTVEIPVAAQGIDDIPHAVMATMTAALFETGDAHLEIDLVIGHQHIGRVDLVEITDRRNRLAATIHEGGGE